jgi:outer membrane receptor protein involved in Fe transport
MSALSKNTSISRPTLVLFSAIPALMLSLSTAAQTIENSPPKNENYDSESKQGDASSKKIQAVEVNGKVSDYDPRRDDTASKTVINSVEILKYGDNNIYDVLKRAPGVTVTGKTLRMRGLGAGYTQVLINGDRPPPGFSLDALSPFQIERIEIFRSATAEYSMQAIAGTINIVLKKVVSKPQRDLRFSFLRSEEQRSLNAGGTWGEKKGDFSYFVNAILYRGTNEAGGQTDDRFILPNGETFQARVIKNFGAGASHGGMFSPRVTIKLGNAGDLNIGSGLQITRSSSNDSALTRNLVGSFSAPDYVESFSSSPNNRRVLTGEIGWVAKFASGKVDIKFSTEHSRVDNDYENEMYTTERSLKLGRNWVTVTSAHRNTIKGKYTRTLFDGHSIALGLDSSTQLSNDTQVREEMLGQAIPTYIREISTPKIKRQAGFVQDEWGISKNLSLYLGVRLEGIQTDSEGSEYSPDSGFLTSATHSRSHVLSPVLQSLYKFQGANPRQLRIALTRTYKAPLLQQLSARRYNVPVNTRFNPDSSGNPNIRPELANGIDLSYEHFLPDDAMLSISASQRKISDHIVDRLDIDESGRWIYHPLNDGDAIVRSIQMEAKVPGKMLGKAATAFDFRASINRNWSRVPTVPGPNNRLDSQIPMSATLGIDFRDGSLTAGVNFVWQQGGLARISDAQSQLQQTRRDLDAYAVWKFNSHYQLRFSVINALGTDDISERIYRDINGLSRSYSYTKSSAQASIALEVKL